MTTPPEVSVIIPTRDRWQLLSTSALPSALCQEDVDFEVIVVDDGSTDETPTRLGELGDARVRILRHERPRGVSATRNIGIAVARGRWLAFLDDDDLWSPRKLRMQLDAARAEGASFVYGATVVLDERRAVAGAFDAPRASELTAQLITWNPIPAGSSNVIAMTDLVRRVGGFDERLSYLADWDLWLRLAMAGRAAACPELLVGYVRHAHGMVFAGCDALREMGYFASKHGSAGLEVDQAGFLNWVALGHRLVGRRLHAVEIYLRSALAYREPRQLVHAAATLLDRDGIGPRQRFRRKPEGTPKPPLPEPAWLERYH